MDVCMSVCIFRQRAREKGIDIERERRTSSNDSLAMLHQPRVFNAQTKAYGDWTLIVSAKKEKLGYPSKDLLAKLKKEDYVTGGVYKFKLVFTSGSFGLTSGHNSTDTLQFQIIDLKQIGCVGDGPMICMLFLHTIEPIWVVHPPYKIVIPIHSVPFRNWFRLNRFRAARCRFRFTRLKQKTIE